MSGTNGMMVETRTPNRLSAVADVARARLAAGEVPVIVHPLGFACARIEPGLCVHAWLPGEPGLAPDPDVSAIHRHSWELAESRVLTGGLANTAYDVAASPRDIATGRLYRIDCGPDADAVIATERFVQHAASSTDCYGPGDVYSLAAGRYHSTHAAEATVTLMRAVDRGGLDMAVGPLRAPSAPRTMQRRPASPVLAEHVTRLTLQHLGDC